MEASIKEIASVLRATEPMAARFAKMVRERVGKPPVTDDEILSVMQNMSAKRLSMKKVVGKLKRERRK